MVEWFWIAVEFILKILDLWETLHSNWKLLGWWAALLVMLLGGIRSYQRKKLVMKATMAVHAFVAFAVVAFIALTLQHLNIFQSIPDRPVFVPTEAPILTLDDVEQELRLTAQNQGASIKTIESRVLVLPNSLSRLPLYGRHMHSDTRVGYKDVITHDVLASDFPGNTFHLRTQPLYIIWDMRYVDAETNVLFDQDFYLQFTSKKTQDGQYETTLEEAELGKKVAIRRYRKKFGIQPFAFGLDIKRIEN